MIVRKIKYVLFVAVICLFPNIVHADCSYERMAELSRIASNVQLSYDYEIVNNAAVYYINITNVTNDIYLIDDQLNEFRSKNEFYQKYSFWTQVTFSIYSNDSACKGEKILDKHVSLPVYNEFSSLPECETYPNFPLCGTWAGTSALIKGDFDNQLASYIKKSQENQVVLEKKSSWQKVLEVLNDNKILLIVCILATILLVVLKRVKK